TWLERFNKQKPHSFEKAIAPVDAENWISHIEKIFDVMGCEDAFKTRLDVYKFEAAGTEEEHAKNFQWGLRKSTLNHLMCMPFTDVAQVANAARNYEILYERDDDDAGRVVIGISRPLNRVVTGTTVIIMTVRDQTGEALLTTTTAATTTTLATTTRIPVMGVTRETGVSSPTDLSILVPSSP
nr:zinc finger, CCHC-type, retrotransposon Gag domain protein [Tanacetum cinerariifolium]